MTTQANKVPLPPRQAQPAALVETIITQLAQKAGMIGVGMVVVMVFFTTTDVLLRFFFNRPIAEVYELTGFMMLIVGCLTIGWCAITDKHVRVDVVVKNFHPKLQEILNILNDLLVIGVSFIMVIQTYKFGLYMMESGAHPTLLKLPYYPFYFVMTLGFCLLLLTMLLLLLRSVYKAVRG